MYNYPKLNKFCLNTSEEDLAQELYEPCLKWADRYDRGVGYFTSGWLAHNTVGMSDFVSRGGKMRLITSPIISNKDHDAIVSAKTVNEKYKYFAKAMDESVDALSREMKRDLLNAFAWMVYDGIIDIKFAVPKNNLDDGNFHDKFGIFYCGQECVSFSGSQNDSIQGFSNYESIKVFCSWIEGIKEFAYSDRSRFERLWNNRDANLDTYSIEESVKKKIFILRTDDRPYKKPQSKNKWGHQDDAIDIFLEKKNGILAMATGTGKTVTAIKIIQKLFADGEIERVIITMYGNDLLDQWDKEINKWISDKTRHKQYGDNKGMQRFLLVPDDAILLVSRDGEHLANLLKRLESAIKTAHQKTLLIFDEVHGAGSNSIVQSLSGRIAPYTYCLGLSATPEREYDEVGNDFIEAEIGPVIYEFSLEDAIKKGILCEFNYYALDYELSDEEKQKKSKIIGTYNLKKKNKEPFDVSDMYRELALINKKAQDKLVKFKEFIRNNTQMLEKSIIFVQDKAFGLLVQDIVFKYKDKFHTYYAEDESENLQKFADGEIDCLITCKKVSEGIDISSVTNIILFASDRSRLVTTQRIGRALRLDKNNPSKRANVVDFIIEKPASDNPEETADEARQNWLEHLSTIRREENE